MSWNLYFDNQTDSTITFCLFQENEILDENSYSVIWYKGVAREWEKVGPIVLPSQVSVSVQPHNGSSTAAPVAVERGDTWVYKEKELQKGINDENDPVVEVEIEGKDAGAVDVSVWKGKDKVFTQKKAENITVSISMKVFVVASDKEMLPNKGDEIQVLAQVLEPTAYELEGGEIAIVARLRDGELKLE